MLFQSCVDHSASENSKVIQQESPVAISVLGQHDSIPSKDRRLIEIGKIFPQWSESSLTLENVKPINANVFSVLCTHSDGVSMTTYLFTFNNDKVKDHEIIVDGADQDLSSPQNYGYKEIRDSTNNKYVVIHYIQSVIDKTVLTKDGKFKTGVNFENVKIKTDSTVTVLSILNDGRIKRDTL